LVTLLLVDFHSITFDLFLTIQDLHKASHKRAKAPVSEMQDNQCRLITVEFQENQP